MLIVNKNQTHMPILPGLRRPVIERGICLEIDSAALEANLHVRQRSAVPVHLSVGNIK